jgi:hypothetical protein
MRAAAREVAERAAPTWDEVARAHLDLLAELDAGAAP